VACSELPHLKGSAAAGATGHKQFCCDAVVTLFMGRCSMVLNMTSIMVCALVVLALVPTH
jgi:hypothetical protein